MSFDMSGDHNPLAESASQPERIGLTGLYRAGDKWSVRIEPFNSNFGGSLYGGAALGAAVEMLESVTGSRVRWATARFLRGPGIGSELVLSHVADFAGRHSSHVTVTATHGEQVAFAVIAVVGNGDTVAGLTGQWAGMPSGSTASTDCPAVPDRPTAPRALAVRPTGAWRDPLTAASCLAAPASGRASRAAELARLPGWPGSRTASPPGSSSQSDHCPGSRAWTTPSGTPLPPSRSGFSWTFTPTPPRTVTPTATCTSSARTGTLLATGSQTCVVRVPVVQAPLTSDGELN